MSNLKEQILLLRKQEKSYRRIESELNCSRGVISYHCQKLSTNEKIKLNNRHALATKLKAIQQWPKQTRELIRALYLFDIYATEIANLLNLKVEHVLAFCKDIFKPKKQIPISNYEGVKKRRKKLKLMSVIYKGGKCQKCGYNDCIEALVFHHIDKAKNKNFTIASRSNVAWKTIKPELDKCILLCSNCHAKVHAEENTPLKELIGPVRLELTTPPLSGVYSAIELRANVLQ